jgi:enamine deaminase RidA (YjgF/YER057c/UK114 family)
LCTVYRILAALVFVLLFGIQKNQYNDFTMFRHLLVPLLLTISFWGQAQTSPDENLQRLGLTLPPTSTPIANYVKWVRTGNLLYTSGHGPTDANGVTTKGKLGADLTIEQGYAAARLTGLQLLATLRQALGGDLTKVKRIVKVLGLVNCTDGFGDQPKVMNGFSDLMVAVFGEKGKHARSAVGTNALPNGMCIEIEMVVEIAE